MQLQYFVHISCNFLFFFLVYTYIHTVQQEMQQIVEKNCIDFYEAYYINFILLFLFWKRKYISSQSVSGKRYFIVFMYIQEWYMQSFCVDVCICIHALLMITFLLHAMHLSVYESFLHEKKFRHILFVYKWQLFHSVNRTEIITILVA